jgi:hypothetical protein
MCSSGGNSDLQITGVVKRRCSVCTCVHMLECACTCCWTGACVAAHAHMLRQHTHMFAPTRAHTRTPTHLLAHLYGWGALCSIRCRRRPPPWSRIRTPRRQQLLLLLLLLLLSAPARHLSSACKTDHKSEHTTVSAADEGEVHTQNSLLLLLLRRSFYICPCVITSCVLAFARYPPVFAFADASLCLTLLEDLLCLLLLGAPLCWCTQPR